MSGSSAQPRRRRHRQPFPGPGATPAARWAERSLPGTRSLASPASPRRPSGRGQGPHRLKGSGLPAPGPGTSLGPNRYSRQEARWGSDDRDGAAGRAHVRPARLRLRLRLRAPPPSPARAAGRRVSRGGRGARRARGSAGGGSGRGGACGARSPHRAGVPSPRAGGLRGRKRRTPPLAGCSAAGSRTG